MVFSNVTSTNVVPPSYYNIYYVGTKNLKVAKGGEYAKMSLFASKYR